jgi:hypothetical protein
MQKGFDKTLVLTLYSSARQAERSIDFALASSRQWELFRDYYDETRLQRLCKLVHILEAHASKPLDSVSRDQIPGITPIWVFFYPFRWLLNRFRNRWFFSHLELSYIVLVFRDFLEATGHFLQPDPKELVQLRMDLSVVQELIEMKLTGLSSLKKARNIEHFCQADHVVSFTMEEICR